MFSVKRWTIYCHTHIESGRRYIGLTSRTMERRWSQHIIQAKHIKGNRSHFANAIRKYGPDAFSHEVLAMSWDLDSANATECALIEQEDTRNPKKGFNLLQGGWFKPNSVYKNPWNDPEYRNKQMKFRTSEFKAKISVLLKKSHSRPEVKERLSKWQRGRTPNRSAVENSILNRREASLLKTHTSCKRHGIVLANDCVKIIRRGLVQLNCRKCAYIRAAEFRARRKSIASLLI